MGTDSLPLEYRVQHGVKCSVSALIAGAVLFVALLFLYTRSNDFPVYYHPDEGGKVEQIIRGGRNYRHPQLLLEVTAIYYQLRGDRVRLASKNAEIPREANQRVVQLGRQVSAGFAAGAAVVLALLAYRFAGMWAMVLAGIGVGLCGPLLVNAHYFKEDASLVFGMSLAMYAAYHVWVSRNADDKTRAWSALWLGAGCAMAVSGKYVGIAFSIPALALLLSKPVRPADKQLLRRMLRSFVLGFILVLVLVNWRITRNPGAFAKSLKQQTREGIAEHKGMTTHKPSFYFLDAVVSETARPIGVLACVGMIAIFVVAVRRRQFWIASLPIVTLYYLALMSFGGMANHRYVLPVTVLVYLLAPLAVVLVLTRSRRQPIIGHAIAVLAVAFLLSAELPLALAINREFGDDSRERVARWLEKNIPPGSVILLDGGLKLNGQIVGTIPTTAPSPDQLSVTRSLLEEMDRGEGVDRGRYVVVCDLWYDRYFNRYMKPLPDFQAVYEHRRAEYTRIFSQGPPLWASQPATPTWSITNPVISVYKITR